MEAAAKVRELSIHLCLSFCSYCSRSTCHVVFLFDSVWVHLLFACVSFYCFSVSPFSYVCLFLFCLSLLFYLVSVPVSYFVCVSFMNHPIVCRHESGICKYGPPFHVQLLLSLSDADGDGELSYHEFLLASTQRRLVCWYLGWNCCWYYGCGCGRECDVNTMRYNMMVLWCVIWWWYK